VDALKALGVTRVMALFVTLLVALAFLFEAAFLVAEVFLFGVDFLVAGDLAFGVDFFVATFLAPTFFAATFLAPTFLAPTFLAPAFLAPTLLAGVLLATAFFTLVALLAFEAGALFPAFLTTLEAFLVADAFFAEAGLVVATVLLAIKEIV
jgi:hypothetical protein